MTSEIYLRVYEELNDFLPPGKRKRRFSYRLNVCISITELLAKLRIPSAQVELVLVNGDSVDFSHFLKPGDFVSLYPVFESFDVTELVRCRKQPLRQIRFLVGPRLARLMHYLRILGFDTVDARSWPNHRIIQKSGEDSRIILTRAPALANCPELSRIYFVRETTPKKQLAEVLRRFDLISSTRSTQLKTIIDISSIHGVDRT
jgi:hypothetical protein